MTWDFLKDHVLTVDNALHSLVAVAFTVGLGWFLPGDFVFAVIAGGLLYVREAWQVDWDWTLRWSPHKHLEWAVGAGAALIAGGLMEIFT